MLRVNFSKFPTLLLHLAIVIISFQLSILPVKEITLYVKPVPTMCFMWGGWGGGGLIEICDFIHFVAILNKK